MMYIRLCSHVRRGVIIWLHAWIIGDVAREALCIRWDQMGSHRARRAAQGGTRQIRGIIGPDPQSQRDHRPDPQGM